MNMLKMIQKAASMKKEMGKIQKELEKKTVEYSSGGKVTVVARGDMSVASIKIDPSVVNSSDVGKLEGLILSAVNGALDAAKKDAGKEMAKLTSGMGLGDLLG